MNPSTKRGSDSDSDETEREDIQVRSKRSEVKWNAMQCNAMEWNGIPMKAL